MMGCRHSLHRVSIGPVTVQKDSSIKFHGQPLPFAQQISRVVCKFDQWIDQKHINKSLYLANSSICQLTNMDSKLSKMLPFTQGPRKLVSSIGSNEEWPRKDYQPEHICGHADILRCLESQGECNLWHKIPSESPTASCRSSDSAMRSADASADAAQVQQLVLEL